MTRRDNGEEFARTCQSKYTSAALSGDYIVWRRGLLRTSWHFGCCPALDSCLRAALYDSRWETCTLRFTSSNTPTLLLWSGVHTHTTTCS